MQCAALQTVDGRISARYRYDEFSIPEQPEKFDPNWPGPDNLFGYTELGYDYYSGLTFANARYFDLTVGRFISEDTYEGLLTDPLSLNLYTYVLINPLRYIDPNTEITANWTINEMKWQWEKAKTDAERQKWANEANKLREKMRAAGIPESDIIQATDKSIPEEVVMQIARMGVE